MSGIQIIDRLQDIQLTSDWVNSPTELIVDKMGTPVKPDFDGHKYRLIVKEKNFSPLRRLGCGFLGIVAVICTLGIALFSDSVRNLFQKKLTLRFGIKIGKDITGMALELGPARSLTEEVGLVLFSHLTNFDLAQCCAVSRSMNRFTDREMVWKEMILRVALGRKAWSPVGDVGAEPPLPENLYETFRKPCPFYPRKVVAQTHDLLLIPDFKLIAGDPTNPFSFMLTPGSRAGPPTSSYWVLITKEFVVAHDRERLSDTDRLALVAKIASKVNINYQLPDTMQQRSYTYLKHNRICFFLRNGYLALRRF